jgi:auxin efflux carrier family protein
LPPKNPYDRRASFVPKRRWITLSPHTKWWLLFIADFFNAPLLGAVIGALIGLLPAVQCAFFSDAAEGGLFTAWFTASLKGIGGLFVPLPVVVAGVSLYASFKASRQSRSASTKLPWLAVSFILFIRFVIWLVGSIYTVYLVASRTKILGPDPMLWFTLMLMPTGPPAMKLITLVQVSDGGPADESTIAQLLTVRSLRSESKKHS